MSSAPPRPAHRPLIALVDRANRALQADMVREAHARGHREIKLAHNLVFGWLPPSGARTADMAARAGVTRQSMGEVVRELVDLGILEMRPDPADRRAKLVTYTEHGRAFAHDGFQHIVDLEQRFADEFGAETYAEVRRVLERVVEIVTQLEDERTGTPVVD